MLTVAGADGVGTMRTLEIVVLVAAAFVLGFAVGRVAGLRTGKKKSG